MKSIFVFLSSIVFGVTLASPSFAQRPRSAFAAVPAPGQPAPTTPTPVPTPTPTPVTPPTAAAPRPGAPGAPAKQEELRIVADPATNSLIIYGTAQEFQSIKNILKELDSVPRQVLMDVLVAEVTLSDTESFGIAYEIFRGNTSIFGQTFGSAGAFVPGIVPSSPTDSTGNIIAGALTGFPQGLTGIVGRASAIRAFINTLATQNRVRALASPSVLATDNRPARIQVGSEIPILTGQTSTFTGTATPLTSNAIQYRNTGVILTIIPQVNSQGLVNLQVKQEVSAVGVPNFGSTGSPSFTTRDAETTAVVQDGDTLAIGGIIQEQKTRDRTGIPYLMDLPYLGRFFSSTKDTTDRTELVILITPHVVRNRNEARDVTEEFKNRISDVRNELERLEIERAAERAKLRPKAEIITPGATAPVTPIPPPTVPAPAVPAPVAPPPVSNRAPGVSMAPTKPTAPPDAQVIASLPVNNATAPAVQPVSPAPPPPPQAVSPTAPAPVVPPAVSDQVPGVSMALTKPAASSDAQVIASLPVNNATAPAVLPVSPAPSPPPPSDMVPEPEPKGNGAEPDRVGVLLNSIESNGAASPNVAKVAAPVARPAGPVWVVQVASFVTDKEAQTLASRLKGKGYDANVASAEVGGKTWYRVEVGRLASRNEARELQKNLQVTEKIEQSIISTR